MKFLLCCLNGDIREADGRDPREALSCLELDEGILYSVIEKRIPLYELVGDKVELMRGAWETTRYMAPVLLIRVLPEMPDAQKAEELLAEGYAEMAEENSELAEVQAKIAHEVLPEYNEEDKNVAG